jgi:hypothetical protein
MKQFDRVKRHWCDLKDWNERANDGWTGAIIGGVSLFGGFYLVFLFAWAAMP